MFCLKLPISPRVMLLLSAMIKGEVMYTSLMRTALEMAQRENDEIFQIDGVQVKVIDRLVTSERDDVSNRQNSTNSILLYTELMRFMVRANGDESREDVLLKVFLTFQEMKAAGVRPDTTCYNSLLRACSFAGDSFKAQDILRRMVDDGVEPNNASYRYALEAAAREGRSDVADMLWNEAVSKRNDYDNFSPRASDFELLVTSYWNEAQKSTNHDLRINHHRKILEAFESLQLRSPDRAMHRISLEEIENNQLLMLTILRSAVSVVLIPRKSDTKNVATDPAVDPAVRERVKARALAMMIADLDVLKKELLPTVDSKTKKALGLARDWLFSD